MAEPKTDGADWLDEISAGEHEWTRISPASIEAVLRPGLPCRIMLGEAEGSPVLYVAIGVNGTVDYWQWTTLDRLTSEPLPKDEAIEQLRSLIEMAMLTSKSQVKSKLLYE